jgi:hypothetical protein
MTGPIDSNKPSVGNIQSTTNVKQTDFNKDQALTTLSSIQTTMKTRQGALEGIANQLRSAPSTIKEAFQKGNVSLTKEMDQSITNVTKAVLTTQAFSNGGINNLFSEINASGKQAALNEALNDMAGGTPVMKALIDANLEEEVLSALSSGSSQASSFSQGFDFSTGISEEALDDTEGKAGSTDLLASYAEKGRTAELSFSDAIEDVRGNSKLGNVLKGDSVELGLIFKLLDRMENEMKQAKQEMSAIDTKLATLDKEIIQTINDAQSKLEEGQNLINDSNSGSCQGVEPSYTQQLDVAEGTKDITDSQFLMKESDLMETEAGNLSNAKKMLSSEIEELQKAIQALLGALVGLTNSMKEETSAALSNNPGDLQAVTAQCNEQVSRLLSHALDLFKNANNDQLCALTDTMNGEFNKSQLSALQNQQQAYDRTAQAWLDAKENFMDNYYYSEQYSTEDIQAIEGGAQSFDASTSEVDPFYGKINAEELSSFSAGKSSASDTLDQIVNKLDTDLSRIHASFLDEQNETNQAFGLPPMKKIDYDLFAIMEEEESKKATMGDEGDSESDN